MKLIINVQQSNIFQSHLWTFFRNEMSFGRNLVTHRVGLPQIMGNLEEVYRSQHLLLSTGSLTICVPKGDKTLKFILATIVLRKLRVIWQNHNQRISHSHDGANSCQFYINYTVCINFNAFCRV